MRKKILGLLCFSLAWQALPAAAAGGLEGVSVSGFLTVGTTYGDKQLLSTTEAVSQDATIENTPGFTADSRLGLQISAKVNEDISITGQLLAKARSENSNVEADWAFINYRLSEQFSVRAGKIKFPTFLISDYYEVGYAYPWIRPPQEVYSSNPITTLNGVDLLARFRFGDLSLLVQPYFGVSRGAQALVPQEAVTNPAYSLCYNAQTASFYTCLPGTLLYTDFTADALRGINVSLSSDIFTVRVGTLKTKVNVPGFNVFQDDVKFSSAGLSMDWHNVVLYSEYFERDIKGLANSAFPNQKGSYTTLGYRIGKWLPHFTAAQIKDNDNPVGATSGIPLDQKSKTLGLRHEVGSGAALKFEVQKVTPKDGTRGLLIAAPSAAPKDPGNDVMIYGISLDVVF
ncbi:hypothetical protein SCL_0529 [Sulfuricaulis limicola]|uniref:Porin n=1 Tax=Sulfuricaulis limicola TaxID=1620215 RepID=A0A1B4XDI1_9GAMM|nr:hypothetical protein [Sulfuricaulis limicola]BAV32851.1 hypothetical protein SCL_0529 [Sulfuricaulis limicola]